MATLTPTRQLTVSEFRQLPDPPGFRIELHNGEVIQVSPPKHKHFKIQQALRELLHRRLGQQGRVATEFPFIPGSDVEFRIADIAFITSIRFQSISDDDNLHGSPDLVVEVLSPSNTAAEMYEKERLCLASGALEFWVVDPNRDQVRVSSQSGPTRVYSHGETIPLTAFDANAIPVDEVFSEL